MPLPPRFREDFTAYVFSAEGEALGKVVVDEELTLLAARGDTIWADDVGALGETLLSRWVVER